MNKNGLKGPGFKRAGRDADTGWCQGPRFKRAGRDADTGWCKIWVFMGLGVLVGGKGSRFAGRCGGGGGARGGEVVAVWWCSCAAT